ncbi:MAG: phenylalanine--tRNA ligase subunit alpha [Candidatus Micrarchaeaceae archaeon]
MHEYEAKLLTFLVKNREAKLVELEDNLDMSKDSVLWAIENLLKTNAITVKRAKSNAISITDEGKSNLGEFPEEALVKMLLKSNGKEHIAKIKNSIGIVWAKKNNWIMVNNGIVELTTAGKSMAKTSTYDARTILSKLNELKGKEQEQLIKNNAGIIDALSKRGLIQLKERSYIESVSINPSAKNLLDDSKSEKGIGALTKEIISNESWKKAGFRSYDINAPVEEIYPARQHPLRELTNLVRQKWLEMGFVEVSGPIVETAFWNFDALFSPQDHPTREMQDTFFLKNPKQLDIEDLEMMQKVKQMHIKGWKEKWSEEISRGALLRTHTTSVSAHYIKKFANALDENLPLKLFSLGSVFRNENLDYKHLAELHQYDGIIIGNNLTLANLIDTLKRFYRKLGLDNIEIRPSYFPFTEPSLEVFYYDEKRRSYIELGGGGIIRKEITAAMGTNKTVLAWGQGLERLMLNRNIFEINSIVDLYKNDVDWLRKRKVIKV